jgi:hypothetical protein
MNPKMLTRLMCETSVLTMDEMSFKFKLWLVNRKDKDDISSVFSIMPITHYMQNRLAIALQNCPTRQQVAMYQAQASAGTRPATALIGKEMISSLFQAICHTKFQNQISIECAPMVRLDEDGGECKSQWHSSHRPFRHEKQEETRLAALGDTFTLAVHPSCTCEYSEDELWVLDFRPDIYYMPNSENQVAIDPFIWHDGHLYVFQFTTCLQQHNIHQGLLQELALYSPPHYSWRLVLVIPDELDEVVCPSLQSSELQDLTLFSSKVKVQ